MPSIRSALPATALVMASLLVPQAHAQPAVRDRLAEIDKAFVCPEDLPDDKAREAALRAFLRAGRTAAPGMTLDDLTRYRFALLEKHHCAETLKNIEALEAREKAPR